VSSATCPPPDAVGSHDVGYGRLRAPQLQHDVAIHGAGVAVGKADDRLVGLPFDGDGVGPAGDLSVEQRAADAGAELRLVVCEVVGLDLLVRLQARLRRAAVARGHDCRQREAQRVGLPVLQLGIPIGEQRRLARQQVADVHGVEPGLGFLQENGGVTPGHGFLVVVLGLRRRHDATDQFVLPQLRGATQHGPRGTGKV
jgi:hypothetical protein